MAKKLTKTQKAKNQAEYKQIRKGYEQTDKSITYKQFKARVQAQKVANDLNTKQAIKKVINSEQFTSAAERSRNNILDSIKTNYRDVYDEIRNLSRWDEVKDESGKIIHRKGTFRNIKENLTWDKDRNGYVFAAMNNLKYFIDITNSPEEVNIYAI